MEKKDDYSRGFAALETLFPGATDAEDNPYDGDISLLFSRHLYLGRRRHQLADTGRAA